MSIESQYFRQYVERDLRRIFEKQREIAGARSRAGSGKQSAGSALRQQLDNPTYMIGESGRGVDVVVKYPLVLRFMDMKHLGNWKIYDRVVWRIIFNNTVQDIKHEFGDWVKRNLTDTLRSATK